MKLSRSAGGLAGAVALTCALGLTPQTAGAAVLLNGCAGGDFGNDCSLGELVGGGTMLISDKLFSNFALVSNSGQALDASVIRVDPLDALYNPGFSLVDTGGTLSFANGGATSNNLSFDVAVVGGPLSIKDNTLMMAVGNLSGDNSFVHVFEIAFTPSDILAQKDAFCNDAITPSCANSTVSDAAVFPIVSALSVDALIDIVSDAAGGVAQIGSITMQFSQTPEPGSLALLTLGLGGLAWSSRRRRQRAAG